MIAGKTIMMDDEQVATAFGLPAGLLDEKTEHNKIVVQQAIAAFCGDVKALADAIVKVLAPMSTAISAMEAFIHTARRMHLHPHNYVQKRHAKWRMKGMGWSGRWYKER